jgi:predicted regulator of Ras-like GTPase activity (Roadblock/LC7/MglB family)
MPTMFTPILERAVATVPGALFAIFADYDGEAVDLTGSPKQDDILLYGAHYGVIFRHVQQLLKLFHFGEVVELVLEHSRMDLLIHSVGHGYFVVMGVDAGVHLGVALREMRVVADELRREVM